MGADTTTGSDWPRIGLLLLCGVFAATQVGKLPPAIPALLREFAAAGRLRVALGLWSSYMALGMTSMLLAAPLWMQSVGWRGGWWFGAVGAAVLYLCVRAALPVRAAPREVPVPALRGLGDPTPWLLGTCFAVYTLQWMAMMVWLPTFLHDDLGFGLAGASAAVAAVIVANAPGYWLGGWLSGRGVAPYLLVLVPALIMGATGALAFAGGLDAVVRLTVCFVFSLCGGVLPAAIYAVLPAVAARRRNFGAVNGLAVQASNLGALVGPPLAAAMVALAAAMVALGGWRAVALAYVATTALSVWAILRATSTPELRGIAVERVRCG